MYYYAQFFELGHHMNCMLCDVGNKKKMVHITIHIESDLKEEDIQICREFILKTEGMTKIPTNLILALRELRNGTNPIKLLDQALFIATCRDCTIDMNILIFGMKNREKLFSGFMISEPDSEKKVEDVWFIKSKYQIQRRVKNARSGCHDREGKENGI